MRLLPFYARLPGVHPDRRAGRASDGLCCSAPAAVAGAHSVDRSQGSCLRPRRRGGISRSWGAAQPARSRHRWSKPTGRLRASRRDQRRVTEVVRRIEAASHEKLPLTALAKNVAMSPYHLLRTFRQVVGMTPHRYVLRTRLHRAAVRIRRTKESISAIAFEVGFDDLSTFNLRFRRMMGFTRAPTGSVTGQTMARPQPARHCYSLSFERSSAPGGGPPKSQGRTFRVPMGALSS